MSKKHSVVAPTPESARSSPISIDSPPPRIADLLDEIEKHLQEANPQRALDVITRARSNSPWLTNAAAV